MHRGNRCPLAQESGAPRGLRADKSGVGDCVASARSGGGAGGEVRAGGRAFPKVRAQPGGGTCGPRATGRPPKREPERAAGLRRGPGGWGPAAKGPAAATASDPSRVLCGVNEHCFPGATRLRRLTSRAGLEPPAAGGRNQATRRPLHGAHAHSPCAEAPDAGAVPFRPSPWLREANGRMGAMRLRQGATGLLGSASSRRSRRVHLLASVVQG